MMSYNVFDMFNIMEYDPYDVIVSQSVTYMLLENNFIQEIIYISIKIYILLIFEKIKCLHSTIFVRKNTDIFYCIYVLILMSRNKEKFEIGFLFNYNVIRKRIVSLYHFHKYVR